MILYFLEARKFWQQITFGEPQQFTEHTAIIEGQRFIDEKQLIGQLRPSDGPGRTRHFTVTRETSAIWIISLPWEINVIFIGEFQLQLKSLLIEFKSRRIHKSSEKFWKPAELLEFQIGKTWN